MEARVTAILVFVKFGYLGLDHMADELDEVGIASFRLHCWMADHGVEE